MVSINRTGLTFDLNFGNNDGAATPVVYDTGGSGLNATAANAQTSTSSYCTFATGDVMTGTATGIYNTAETSIAFKFKPTWAANNGVQQYLFDTSNGSRYTLVKESNNNLTFLLGSTVIQEMALATYQDYWKVNEENVIIISSSATTDRTDVYLNGTKILDQDTTAWTQANPGTFYIGTYYAATSFWANADIYYLKVWSRLLTTAEIAALSADRKTSLTPVTMRTGLTLNLEMGNNNTTTTVYDTSTNAYNATETGTVTFANTGVDLPGTNNNYLTATATGVFNSANQSMAIKFTPDFDWDENVTRFFFDTATPNQSYFILKRNDASSNTLDIRFGGGTTIAIPSATYSPYWKVNEENILVITGTTGSNNAWLNGNQVLTADATAWSATNPTNITIGSQYNGQLAFDGEMHYFKTWTRIITAAEIAALSADRVYKFTAANTTNLA